jgi:4-hydroxy-3-methylbut-2-en-1-yl diphosphate reductase
VLIGHGGHPEVEGTMGQLPDGAIALVENAADAERFRPRDPERLAYITQTTLSVDDTSEIVTILRRRFPNIAGPHKEDICYATTNRQDAMKAVAPRADVVFVIGAPNSSNSRRLVEVALRAGAKKSALIQRASDIDWSLVEGATSVGLSAGASAPEVLVEDVIAAFRARYDLTVEEISVTREDVTFNVPRVLAS